jgi:YegS/Rv2252/BmrU family lipid kinase
VNHKIAFIVNPMSGTTKKTSVVETINKTIDRDIFTDVEIVFTECKGHGTKLANQFMQEGYDVIGAVGGDGTINEVAKALVHTNIALAVIPSGSGNGLARHLNIPTNISKAIQHINKSEIIKIDYGLANDYPFFCTAGTGFDAFVSQEFEGSTKRGIIGYMEKMATSFLSYKPEVYKLIADGVKFEGEAFVITFANASQWGNNVYIAPQASVQDGLLDVSIITNIPFLSVATIAIRLFTKTIHKDLQYNTLRTKEITLLQNSNSPFHLDGDPIQMGKEIKIKIVPEGLNVVVKRRF